MANNITSLIYRRHIGTSRSKKESTWLAQQMLENLYSHERCFDHDDLQVLYLLLMSFMARCPLIRNAVIDKIREWEEEEMKTGEEVVRSHVFLVNYIAKYLSEDELDMFEKLVDNIKQNTN